MGLYLVQSFKGANIFTKLAFIFLFIAMFAGWIAYCTPSWGRGEYTAGNVYTGWGVWRVGGNQEATADGKPTDGWLLEWYGAFQAFATFGFICLNVGFFLVVLFMFVTPCKSNGDLAFWNAINNIFGVICWLIAVILFGARFDKKFDSNFSEHELHYSFGLAIVALVFQLAAGIVLLLTTRGGGAVQSSK